MSMQLSEQLAARFGAQAVQIHVALNAPVSGAQLVHYVTANAGAAKAQLLIGVQQSAGVEFVAHGFLQHALFIGPVLQGQWVGWQVGGAGAVVVGQGVHRADSLAKQLTVALGLAQGLLARLRFCFALCNLLALKNHQRFTQLLEISQRCSRCCFLLFTHKKPSSAIDRAAPGATMM